MTLKQILDEIEKCSLQVLECNQKLEALKPTFLYADEVTELENMRADALSLREGLFDLLRDGGDET